MRRKERDREKERKREREGGGEVGRCLDYNIWPECVCVCCACCVNIQAEILKSPRKPSGVLARAILVVRGEDGWNGGELS